MDILLNDPDDESEVDDTIPFENIDLDEDEQAYQQQRDNEDQITFPSRQYGD